MFTNNIKSLTKRLKVEATEVVNLLHATGLSFTFHSVSKEVANLVKVNLVPFFSLPPETYISDWEMFYTKNPIIMDETILQESIVSEVPFGKRYEKQNQIFIHYDRWSVVIIADKTERVIIIGGKSEKDCATSIIRLITQILLFTTEVNQRFTLLHAASVFVGGRLMVFMSPSGKIGEQVVKSAGHGKTTAQLSAALYMDAIIHTGDILILNEQGIFAHPDIYKVNQATVASQATLKPLRQLPVYKGDICLTPNDWKIVDVNCAGGAVGKTIDLLCFVDLKPRRQKYSIKPVSKDEALYKLRNSVRYDHLTDSWHNPNLLNLPRKSTEQLIVDADILTEKLIKNSRDVFLFGGIQLEKVAVCLKSLED